MPKDGSYYPLGKKPKERNKPTTMEGGMQYPTLHISPEEYAPMKDMKLGGTGEACVKFKISKYGGIDVIAMKPLKGGSDGKKD